MSSAMRNRLRKLAIIVAAALAALGWAAAAAAQDPAPPPRPEEPPIALPDQPDSGEPGHDQRRPAPGGPSERIDAEDVDDASDRSDKVEPGPSVEELLAKLPASWDRPELLAQASIEINSLLAQAETERRLVPWPMAEGFRRSLIAGRQLAEQIGPETRPAYFQSLYFSALAAGYPDQALAAALDLVQLDRKSGWNWLALYRAGMICGDKATCEEAVDNLRLMVNPQMIEPLKAQAEPIGAEPQFTIELSDGTKFSPAAARGKVVVFDFWIHTERTYMDAFPLVRRVFTTFKDYAAFRMIGVNMDRRSYQNLARQFMRANKMDWPVHFEGQAGDRPISFKAFKTSRVPSHAVLSPAGKVIYLGLPNDPLLYYAIRAGLVSAADGKVPTTQPDSNQPPARAAVPPGGQAGTGPKAPSPDPALDLAAKAALEKAAAEQLRIGEAFEAADYKPKAIEVYRGILRNYPDTDAAMKAQARLLVLER